MDVFNSIRKEQQINYYANIVSNFLKQRSQNESNEFLVQTAKEWGLDYKIVEEFISNQ